MNPIDTQIRYALMADAVPVVVVDEVDGGRLTYVGYCLESCAGFADAKWLIKRIEKSKGAIEKKAAPAATDGAASSDTPQADAPATMEEHEFTLISYPGGDSHSYKQRWDERAELSYQVTPQAAVGECNMLGLMVGLSKVAE